MIKGYGEMMRDLPGEKTDENLEVIIKESERLKYLVDDLLDLSKLEEQVIELHCTEFSLTDLVQRNVSKYNYYHVQDQFDIPFMAQFGQFLQIFLCPKGGVDLIVIRHVIFMV